MTIVKTVDIPDFEIEELIDNEVLDSALDLIEDHLRENYDIGDGDLGQLEYIFFLNTMKDKIDERIARWI